MIIPYGHRGIRIRGVPWATVGIGVLCIVVFGLTATADKRASVEAGRLFAEIAQAWMAEPDLTVDPSIQEMIFAQLGVDENEREVFVSSMREQSRRTASTAGVDQREMDRLVDRFWVVYRGAPAYRFGVVPAGGSPAALISYQFLHGGWLHLVGNLLFLVLVGPHIEQRWGRVVFTSFYLASGVVAALFWAIRYPDIDVPLVGASGSIAGLMGAFLICFGSSKIRFFYWFGIIWGTFEAPAWLMLPLWLAIEVVSGRSMDVLSPNGGGGVAHWAHVWGFIFGMAFAWVLGLVGADQRLAARTGVVAAEHAGGSPGSEPLGVAQRPTARRSSPPAVDRSLSTSPPDAIAPTAVDEKLPEAPAVAAPASEVEPIEVAAADGPVVEIRPAERLRVLAGVPRSIDSSALEFETGAGARRLDLAKVHAVAVGAVATPGRRPFLIIDLLLDSPSDGSCDLRVVRLQSSDFDPRAVAGGASAMEGFVRLVRRLVDVSGAPALPEPRVVAEPARRMYRSLDEYQGEVLGVMGRDT